MNEGSQKEGIREGFSMRHEFEVRRGQGTSLEPRGHSLNSTLYLLSPGAAAKSCQLQSFKYLGTCSIAAFVYHSPTEVKSETQDNG